MNKLTYISKTIIFAVFCTLCSHLAAQQVVAILEPVAGPGVGRLNINSVWGTMEEFLTKSKKYRVVDRKRSGQVFNELHLQRTSVMIDPNTTRAIGKHLSAALVCVSEIIKEQGYTNINISLINVETGIVVGSGTRTVTGTNPGVIADAVDGIASQITGIEGKLQRAIREGRKVENKTLRRNRTFGIYVSGGLPIGEFGSLEFAPTFEFPVSQSEGYDFGFGARGTMNFPLFFKSLGMRLGADFAMNPGTNTAPGYGTMDLSYTAIGASGELQFFFDESFRHKGTYLFGGATINHESFNRVSDGFTDTYRKMRFAGTAGIGHTFSGIGNAGGWTAEIAYHTTLTNKESGIGETIAADCVRFSIGFVF